MGGDSSSRRNISFAAELSAGASEFGVRISANQLAAFDTYVETLLFWASRLSLTAARSAGEIAREHILDSLALVRWMKPGWRVADLGSGAGFPGIPLAIARPDVTFELVEPRRKRANFLREVVRRCHLRNVTVLDERAEDLPTRTAASFDAVVSRAVFQLSDFLAISAALLRSEGLAIAMKGPRSRTHVPTAAAFFEPQILDYTLPVGIQRLLLVYRRR